jgi:2-dehydropantoate 2-reductase
MRFVILGAGALGSIIAGHLARAGEDVIVIARGDRARYIQQHGITLTGRADFTIACPVITDPVALHEADVLIVAVKTYDMAAALTSLRHLKVDTVLSIQNGVPKNEQLADAFGTEKVVGAATFLSGEVLSDGPVRFTANQVLYVGEIPAGTFKPSGVRQRGARSARLRYGRTECGACAVGSTPPRSATEPPRRPPSALEHGGAPPQSSPLPAPANQFERRRTRSRMR